MQLSLRVLRRCAALLCVFLLVFLFPASSAKAAGSATVDEQRVRVRSGPSTSTAILAVLEEGDPLEITSYTDGWYQVTYRDENGDALTGYIRGDLVLFCPETNGFGCVRCAVATSGCTLFRSADSEGGTLTVLEPGETVLLLDWGAESGWTLVRTLSGEDPRTGYVQTRYLRLSPAARGSLKDPVSLVDETGTQLARLSADRTVEVLDQLGNWYEVRTGALQGYVPAEEVLLKDTLDLAGYAVTEEPLSLYAGRDEAGDVLEEIPEGVSLMLDPTQEADWYGTSFHGTYGFVPADRVTVRAQVTQGSVQTLDEPVSLRAGLWYDAPVLDTLPASSLLTVLGSFSGWYLVDWEGLSGFVWGEDVTAVSPGPDEASVTAGAAVAAFASQYVGNPYVWGGTSLTGGADCSGFVMSVYRSFGVSLPHSSAALRSCGQAVSLADIQPGDIVCYDGHVGIYTGEGQIINALNQEKGIVYSPLNPDRVLTVRRIFS